MSFAQVLTIEQGKKSADIHATLVLCGQQDQPTPPEVHAEIAASIGDARGLGFLIVSASAFFRYRWPLALVLLSLMGVVLFQIIVVIERIFFPWSADSAGNSFL
jgi:NitT/TauT family transport system permease protein